MPITEDLDAYFADFGVTASFAGESAEVLFDYPDNVIAGDQAITAEYMITFNAAKFTSLKRGSQITVDGTAYTVNANPLAIEDGKMKTADLSIA